MDGDSLWVRLSKSLYGKLEAGGEGFFKMGRESRWSSWWKYTIENVSGEEGGWFWNYLERRISDWGWGWDIDF